MDEENMRLKRLDRVKVIEKKTKHYNECGVVASFEQNAEGIIVYHVWFPQTKTTGMYEDESLEKL